MNQYNFYQQRKLYFKMTQYTVHSPITFYLFYMMERYN